MAHNIFRGRTVMVGEGGAQAAFRSLSKIINNEGMSREVQLKRRYEKPTVKRRRLVYESAQKIYNEEMKNKVAFLFRVQRNQTPWS
eukprot:gene7883-8734_t